MRAPWASTTCMTASCGSPCEPGGFLPQLAGKTTAPDGTARRPLHPARLRSAIPLRRVRRIDHAAVGALELAELCHLGIAQLEVEDGEIGGEMAGIGGARDRNDALLHEIAQRDLRRAFAMRLGDAF